MPENIIQMTGGVIRQQKNTILKNVNIEIQSGEFVYLIGKVGSGKSSFLKTLYAELPLEYGNAEVAGFQLKKIRKSHIPLLRRKCGIVFQDFKLLTDRNVYDNLEFVLRATGWKNKKAVRERIETVLEKVGMTHKQQQMPHQLSGGEQQRIVLARALLNAPPLILADEPTGNIDPETSYQLVELLKEICSTGKTIIIATHQYDLIEKFPGRVFCCENGELYEKKSASAENVPQEDSRQANIEEVTVAPAEIHEVAAMVENQTKEDNQQAEKKTMLSDSGLVEENSTEADLPEEDILSLIGKLDYPEITAFDYEIQDDDNEQQELSVPSEEEENQLTAETAPEDQENAPDDRHKPKNNPPVFDLELID